MKPMNTPFDSLDCFAPGGEHINVIIETPKGHRNKFKYEPDLGLFLVHKVLPAGAVFPFDFGFIPATIGDDGDPLDILLFMDEPAFTGCLVPTRLIGVIEAQQTEEGKTRRNDRLIGVAAASRDHANLDTLKTINPHLLKEIEHFFTSYNAIDDKEFKPLGVFGPNRAQKLVEQGHLRCQVRQPAPEHETETG